MIHVQATPATSDDDDQEETPEIIVEILEQIEQSLTPT